MKILAVALVIVLITNLLLFAFGVIGQFLFWVIIILAAVFAYNVLPQKKV